MPERDGAALCRELRQLRPGLPRISMTTDRWFDSGALTELALTATLNKPAKRTALQQALLAADVRGPAAGRRISPSGQFWALAEQRAPKILGAEDNAFNQVVIVRMLAKLGHSADVVDNGSVAVEAVTRRVYDVVLMDMHMLVMDGLAAAEAIGRHFAAGGRPHIIASTAAALAEERQRCIDAGMDDHVSKPIVVERLIEAIERIPRKSHQLHIDVTNVWSFRELGSCGRERAEFARWVYSGRHWVCRPRSSSSKMNATSPRPWTTRSPARAFGSARATAGRRRWPASSRIRPTSCCST